MERLRGRFGLGERVGPGTLEIDRVGQHQPGVQIQASRRQDVLDPVFGLSVNPAVDIAPGSLRAGLEVRLVEAGLVIALADVQESREEGMALLRPQGIGEAQLDAFLVVGLVELSLQLTKGGMELRLVGPEGRTWAICVSVLPRAPA